MSFTKHHPTELL